MSKKERIPTIQSLYEAEFGDEISQINKWFKDQYDESYSFNWDGDSLTVKDGDDKEVETISRADLAGKIEGFPEKTNEEMSKFKSVGELNSEIDNFLTDVYDKGDAQAAKDAAKQLVDNINKMVSDLD
jgi:hypothetical protein